MEKRNCHDHLQYFVVFMVVQSLQATDYPPLRNDSLSITMVTHEPKNDTASSSGLPAASSKEGGNITTLHNPEANWNTSTESNSPSYTAAEIKTEMTTQLATKLFFNHSAYQATTKGDSKVTTSATAWKIMTRPSQTSLAFSSNVLFSSSASQSPAGARLKHSETLLTTGFAVVLVLTVLGFIVYLFNRYRKQRDQYSHHPLYNASSDVVDNYATPDDTLVISGGLYDAPPYNSSLMVYEDDDLQIDHIPFSVQPGQYKLEFLPAENEKSPASYETFQISPGEF